jgi:hypothetical protein
LPPTRRSCATCSTSGRPACASVSPRALGKNRSFITQIANPAYQTPIPAQHVHPIIQICHFSAQEKDRFLEAYHRAHPRRLLLLKERERSRRLTLMLPDLGSEQKNRKLDALLSEFAKKSQGWSRIRDAYGC